MIADDMERRDTILRALYDHYLKLSTVVITKEQLMESTKLDAYEVARCVEYLRSKRYVKVEYLFGDDFHVSISTRGIDALESHQPGSELARSEADERSSFEQNSGHQNVSGNFTYDVAISYAGENEKIAIEVHDALKQRGISCYLAVLKRGVLWGKRLDKVFEQVFGEQAHYVIVLVSKEYKGKIWTDYELQTAIQSAKRRHGDYILPVRLDPTIVAGILSTIGYLDYEKEGCEGIADALREKLSEDRNRSRVVSVEQLEDGKVGHEVRRGAASSPDSSNLAGGDHVCSEGPFDIEPGSHSVISLDLHKGDTITGSLDEVDGETFDWYIVDERNLVKFKRKEEYTHLRGDEGLGAYHLKKMSISKDGPWFLLVSTYGKQNPRRVQVRLRKEYS